MAQTVTLHYGGKSPIVAIGKNQVNLLDFAFRFKCWHTYKKDRATLRAINALEKKGCLIVDRNSEQFIFTFPESV